MHQRSWAALAAAVVVLAGSALPVSATSIETRVTRANDAGDARLYVPAFASFVAESDEALLTLSRPTGDCLAPGPACTLDTQCPGGVCRSGNCRYPESVQVGYVALMRLEDFCNVAACLTPPMPPECLGGTCDGSSCAVPTSRLNGFCLCAACDETDPPLAPGVAPFVETFADTSDPRWALEHAAFVSGGGRSYLKFLKPEYANGPGLPMTTPQIGLAQIHLHGLIPGVSYMVAVKWTFAPYPSATACPTYSGLSIDLTPVASVCAP